MVPGKSSASTSVNPKVSKTSGPTEWLKPLSEFTSVLQLSASPSICLDVKVNGPKTLTFTTMSPAAMSQRKGQEADSTPGVPVLQFSTTKHTIVEHICKGKVSSPFYGVRILSKTMSSAEIGCPTPKVTLTICAAN